MKMTCFMLTLRTNKEYNMTWKDIPNLTSEDQFPALMKQLKEIKATNKEHKTIIKEWLIRQKHNLLSKFYEYIVKECGL